jgi:hypothetical protein
MFFIKEVAYLVAGLCCWRFLYIGGFFFLIKVTVDVWCSFTYAFVKELSYQVGETILEPNDKIGIEKVRETLVRDHVQE